MTGADKVACQAATLILLFTLSCAPAKAQFAGFGGGGEDMMTQMAPMLEMMKAKMGKRRFGQLMKTVGPMMSKMMDNGGADPGGAGLGGADLGGVPGGFPGATGVSPGGFGGIDAGGFGGGNAMAMLGGNGGEMMSLIPQLIGLANSGGHRKHHRRHRRHR
ncbi:MULTISPECIES: hypothetical protein [Rhodopseudomonas]|uniref:Uncharacterized protein n=1 Tax=Rhodopseudomonas palustris TaxID=1076 RepID=A0A0D7F4Y3_RHOPL|nr:MULTISPECIES: hypothetical protein [Rhodopseudomonas]KIZ48163.1 hypothetical protein OO17_00325 [Rhodopseudomonas palustris]MDF3812047.1 hypothetical protein [Rhodopseudomonas sp. BAL398]WOK16093.1 hypothetical protein RBJ75_18215 [Rhodopseudomonas sp. BAL398]